jgi:phage baseplate assembly protein gpV
MSNTNIRIAKVSSVNYETGMIRVTYTDKGKAVSTELPYANQNSEYFMPNVGEYVQVALLSNGTTKGVVTGTYWGKGNKPPESGKGIYRKDFSKTPGTAMMRYDDKTGELLIKGANAYVNGVNKARMTAPHLELECNYDASIEMPKINLSGSKTELNSTETEIIMKLKSLEKNIKELLKISGENAEIEFLDQLNLKAAEINFNIAGLSITFGQMIERIEAVEAKVGITWP